MAAVKHEDLTRAQKMAMYKTGNYRFKAPPVCCVRWSDDSWLRFIDSYRGWMIPEDGDFTIE